MNRSQIGWTAAAFALVLGMNPSLAQAQDPSSEETPEGGDTPDPDAENTSIESITITAQKRAQRSQDVAISVTAVSGDQISDGNFGNAQEITSLAAGISTIQPNGEANYAIAIRGVANSDFTTNVESPVAIYMDEVYISQMSGAGFQLFDMERVEFLRGPQGTLFGRNATGGLAHFITRKPSEELEGYVRLTYGRFDQFKAEAAVGGAVIPGLLSVRASGAGHWNNGYVVNRLDLDNNLNNANDQAGRFQLLFTPLDDLSLLVNVRAATQNIRTGFFEYVSSVRPGELTPGEPNPVLNGYVDVPGNVFEGAYNDPGFNKLDTLGATATLNWSFESITVTSITDYQTVKRDYIEDSDASPEPFFNFFLNTDAQQFSQELRVAGNMDWLNWVAGFYYLDLQVGDANGFESEPFGDFVLAPAVGLEPTADLTGFDVPYTTDTQSWSFFGQVGGRLQTYRRSQYEVTERFGLEA
ncbi:MAG: TonB-dependent receptor plug domain-containing protein, partial [Myxococcota bacterium]